MPHADKNAISAETALRLQEQKLMVKLAIEDIALLTKMYIYLSYEFHTFLQILQAMHFLCCFLGGASCASAVA